MRKIGKRLLIIALVGIIGCAKPMTIPNSSITTVVKAAKVKFKENKCEVILGKQVELDLVGVKKKDYGQIVWTSSNEKVATVSQKGIVTSLSEGTTLIHATYKEKEYECEVTVKRDDSLYTISLLLLGEGLDYHFDDMDVVPGQPFGKFPKAPKKDKKGRKFQYWYIVKRDRSMAIVDENTIVPADENFYHVYAKYEFEKTVEKSKKK